jgi:hypothetical protein
VIAHTGGMRRLVLVLVLFAWTALAAPAPKPRMTWADWVGDYTGTLAWTRCTAAGATKATITVDAIDGALVAELARAADWLPALSLLEENGTLAGSQADLAVVLARPKANAIDVAIDLDSGCRARGRLVRASKGAACDRLVGWARVEARCTKLRGPPLEPKLGKLERCEARATALESELVDAGCAPNPDPDIGLRSGACVAAVAQVERLERCASAPQSRVAQWSRMVHHHAAAAQTATTAGELAKVEQTCVTLRRLVDQLLAESRCL